MTPRDYTKLSLAEVREDLAAIARDTETTFAGLNAQQLNWRPDEQRWSMAQCFEHLLTSNDLMFRGAQAALDATAPGSVWRRLPGWPGFAGRALIRSQSPQATRKYVAPPSSRPAVSASDADVVQRFLQQLRSAAERAATLDEGLAARTIMTSPFLRVITYSVLDGWRLLVAHARRHVEQARRVMQAPAFPKA
jgi:hypothetical protein